MGKCAKCGKELKGNYCSRCGLQDKPEFHQINDLLKVLLLLIAVIIGMVAIASIFD